MNNNPQLDIKKTNALIKRKNTLFKKATKPQKRVMIAKDVLAQLKAKKYQPNYGSFVQFRIDEASDSEESVQKLFSENKITECRVCALGGLFMSCTNLNNNTTLNNLHMESSSIGDFIEDNISLSNELNKFFTKSQFILIENYFEGGRGWFYKQCSGSHLASFSITYESPESRMIAIMKNIIENKGTFIPEKIKVV